jgi:hypothetical protein
MAAAKGTTLPSSCIPDSLVDVALFDWKGGRQSYDANYKALLSVKILTAASTPFARLNGQCICTIAQTA